MYKYKFLFLLIIFPIYAHSQSPFYSYCEANGKKMAPTYEKANCVEFMDKVLKAYLEIPNEVSKLIYINHSKVKIEKALQAKDTSVLGGVCYALVKFGFADWVSYDKIKQGDIVQYWSNKGFINGHCGVFKKFDKNGNMLLEGSHPDSKGYGEMNVNNKNIECYFFIVRLRE